MIKTIKFLHVSNLKVTVKREVALCWKFLGQGFDERDNQKKIKRTTEYLLVSLLVLGCDELGVEYGLVAYRYTVGQT